MTEQVQSLGFGDAISLFSGDVFAKVKAVIDAIDTEKIKSVMDAVDPEKVKAALDMVQPGEDGVVRLKIELNLRK